MTACHSAPEENANQYAGDEMVEMMDIPITEQPPAYDYEAFGAAPIMEYKQKKFSGAGK